jgi:hypothetical protein
MIDKENACIRVNASLTYLRMNHGGGSVAD